MNQKQKSFLKNIIGIVFYLGLIYIAIPFFLFSGRVLFNILIKYSNAITVSERVPYLIATIIIVPASLVYGRAVYRCAHNAALSLNRIIRGFKE